MANAVCTQCGLKYHYPNRRGSRLSDYPSPCCAAAGKANRYSPAVRRLVSRCPDCGKAGLWWAKALVYGTESQKTCPRSDWGKYLWCPRCKKWVAPIEEWSTPVEVVGQLGGQHG